MVRIAMASYRGAMTVSAIHIPPTGMYPYHYFQPLEQWLRNFTLDLGDGTTTRPYNPNIALEIAAEARRTLGDMVPTNENLLRQYMGAGWWNNDLASAEKLMVKGGMRRNAQGIWQFANGQPFQITLMVMPEGANPSLNRAGAMLVENWREFGIDVVLEVRADFGQFLDSGDYDAVLFWNIETWGGHPDLSFFLSEFHSSQFVPSGEMAGRNTSRWRNPQVDRIVEELQRLDMEHPRVVELGREFVQIALYDMFQIPISSYNVFSVMDTHFWTGFPSINDPFANPVCNWTNWRYIFLRLRPTGR
jgi:peptide/nickel transport system substrate-binding protein